MQNFYFIVLCLLALERVFELFLSRKNQKKLLSKGYEFAEPRWQIALMIFLHLSWFVALFLEPILIPRPADVDLFIIALATLLFAQLLRLWVIKTLGEEWNISVMCPSDRGCYDENIIKRGPYKYIRHPNYLAIVLEFASVPLIGAAYFTSFIFSVLNVLVLKLRISQEEKVLNSRAGYAESFGRKRSFLPSLSPQYHVISLTPKRTH